mmetsp:Transcript_56865/g.165104  ORF Transcript_56865/g.165104 Transcript_56865/m.165104 type:complete len:475 (-) Transcript_56865:122-1546(-)
MVFQVPSMAENANLALWTSDGVGSVHVVLLVQVALVPAITPVVPPVANLAVWTHGALGSVHAVLRVSVTLVTAISALLVQLGARTRRICGAFGSVHTKLLVPVRLMAPIGAVALVPVLLTTPVVPMLMVWACEAIGSLQVLLLVAMPRVSGIHVTPLVLSTTKPAEFVAWTGGAIGAVLLVPLLFILLVALATPKPWVLQVPSLAELLVVVMPLVAPISTSLHALHVVIPAPMVLVAPVPMVPSRTKLAGRALDVPVALVAVARDAAVARVVHLARNMVLPVAIPVIGAVRMAFLIAGPMEMAIWVPSVAALAGLVVQTHNAQALIALAVVLSDTTLMRLAAALVMMTGRLDPRPQLHVRRLLGGLAVDNVHVGLGPAEVGSAIGLGPAGTDCAVRPGPAGVSVGVAAVAPVERPVKAPDAAAIPSVELRHRCADVGLVVRIPHGARLPADDGHRCGVMKDHCGDQRRHQERHR